MVLNLRDRVLDILFLPKLLPREDIIGGPILIYHRVKNLSMMGHRITLIAPAYDYVDREDKSLKPYCERIILVDSVKDRTGKEMEALHKRLRRPGFFLSGDGGYNEGLENKFKALLSEAHFDAIIAEYSMMGQYIEANKGYIPEDTLGIISVHECYTRAFELRARKGEVIDEETTKEIFRYEFKMYRTADRIITLTREDMDILVDYAPELKECIRVVPHGVDTRFWTPPPKRSWEGKNVLFVGNFRHYPNVDAVKNFINRCWGRILESVPDARFYAVGLDPPEELLDLRSASVIVRQGGDNNNMRRTYRESDVFVAPLELGTGFRGKIIEAMATGLPVIATPLATFGIDPLHGRDMFVAEDYDRFAEYVIMLLRDRELRKRISADSIRLARKFDHKAAAERLEEVLLEPYEP